VREKARSHFNQVTCREGQNERLSKKKSDEVEERKDDREGGKKDSTVALSTCSCPSKITNYRLFPLCSSADLIWYIYQN